MTRSNDPSGETPAPIAKPNVQTEPTYPAGMERERSQPIGLGRNKPGPKNPPEAAIVEDDD